jgi:hypothetical protein
MFEHLLKNSTVAYGVYSAPRDSLNLDSLVSQLDTPAYKRRRMQALHQAGPDTEVAPDIEMPSYPPRAPSSRVCFRICFKGDRKTVSVPIGAGGQIKKGNIAITLHAEPEGIAVNDGIVVENVSSASSELSAHFVLQGFHDIERAEAEASGRVCALQQDSTL